MDSSEEITRDVDQLMGRQGFKRYLVMATDDDIVFVACVPNGRLGPDDYVGLVSMLVTVLAQDMALLEHFRRVVDIVDEMQQVAGGGRVTPFLIEADGGSGAGLYTRR